MEISDTIYKCIPCNFETKSKTNYRNHMYTMRHHKNVKKKKEDDVSVIDHLEEISPSKSKMVCNEIKTNDIVSSPWDYGEYVDSEDAVVDTTEQENEDSDSDSESIDEDEFKCDYCGDVQGLNNCEMCDAENVCESCHGQGGDYGPCEIWVCNKCLPTCNVCGKKLYTAWDKCCGKGRSDLSDDEEEDESDEEENKDPKIVNCDFCCEDKSFETYYTVRRGRQIYFSCNDCWENRETEIVAYSAYTWEKSAFPGPAFFSVKEEKDEEENKENDCSSLSSGSGVISILNVASSTLIDESNGNDRNSLLYVNMREELEREWNKQQDEWLGNSVDRNETWSDSVDSHRYSISLSSKPHIHRLFIPCAFLFGLSIGVFAMALLS
jgi:hypothetical protein